MTSIISKTKVALLLVIAVGLFMRSYQLVDRFYYNHDNDLSSWIVKDIVVDKHLRLIGQLTSSPGIFIGPFFYYSLIPFYLLAHLDPLGALGFPLLIGLASVISVYVVFSKLYSQPTGLIAAFIFAASFSIAMTERQIVPTTPVFLWSIWFYYCIHRLFQGGKWMLLPLAVLFALVWHIHLALALLAPLVIIGIAVNYSRYKIRDFLLPISLFLLLSLPLIIFESRHSFIQTKSLFLSFSEKTTVSRSFTGKIFHVLDYTQRDLNIIFWDRPSVVTPLFASAIIFAGFIYLIFTHRLSRRSILIYLVWFLLYLIFFSLHPINLSEYYLDGLSILYVAIATLCLSAMFSSPSRWKIFALLILTFFLAHNLFLELTFTINHSGYIERKNLVNFIAADASKHHYPCVAVSYITTPGNDLGYRYLFWLANLKVNRPIGGAPVYSVVFPLNLVNRLDTTFGALGLVLPDYDRYTSTSIATSCSGENENLTYPMFGFTK